jgi:hypothetical protein
LPKEPSFAFKARVYVTHSIAFVTEHERVFDEQNMDNRPPRQWHETNIERFWD